MHSASLKGIAGLIPRGGAAVAPKNMGISLSALLGLKVGFSIKLEDILSDRQREMQRQEKRQPSCTVTSYESFMRKLGPGHVSSL